MSEWLDNLKVGDPVIVKGNGEPLLRLVERLTATMVVTTSGSRFRRNTGYRVGDDPWHFTWIEEPPKRKAGR